MKAPDAVIERAVEPSASDVVRRDSYDWLVWWITVISYVATAVAVVIAAIAYFADRRAEEAALLQAVATEQRAASLSRIESYTSGDLLSARKFVLRQFLDLGGEQLALVPPEPAALMAVKDAMAESSGDPVRYDLALVEIVEFFDRLEACVDARVCDAEVLRSQVDTDAARFHCFFKPAIEKLRKDLFLRDFGTGARAAARRVGTCPGL